MIKKILITVVALFKAFWNATVRIAIGIAVVYLLAGLIQGMDIDASNITDLLSMSIILIKYWIVFWIAFFASNLYKELKLELFD